MSRWTASPRAGEPEWRRGWDGSALRADACGSNWHRGRPLFQAGLANLNPWTEARVPRRAADRGPLLIIAAERDHTVPAAVSRAAYRIQKRNAWTTELVSLPEAGHSLVIDNGWETVARKALAFVEAQTGTATGSPLRAIAS